MPDARNRDSQVRISVVHADSARVLLFHLRLEVGSY